MQYRIKDKSKINPGFHKQFLSNRFKHDEQKILNRLSREWYLTNSGSKIRIATTGYNFFLMKPTEIFSEMFNIDRELICVFSDFPNFEPRTLDAFDVAQKSLSDLRVESVCRVLISRDCDVERKITNLIKADPEQPIVIPFSYDELLGSYDNYFIRNRFRNHFYTRDLFSFFSPLKKDLYFFGRNELIQDIINRHRSGEHTGLFGLRKSGKTSIIYAVERSLHINKEPFISFDCELPSIHKSRWNELLHKLAVEYQKVSNSNTKLSDISSYNEKDAAQSFEKDILNIYNLKKIKSVLLIFDEIERISPQTGSSPHWRDGEDFIFFWQTLRGFFQRHSDVFTYMLSGTNPSCIESPMICNQENPIFSSIPCQFVPAFDVKQVREMVRKLGKFMGMKFGEIIYSKLTEDFGGHPFLIRHMCSRLNRFAKGDRPITIDKALYEKVRKTFTQDSIEYLDMIVQILRDSYPDEYDMLTFLAQGDIDTFEQFANDHTQYTKHLIGYGLVQYSKNGYSFNIEAVKEFLEKKHKFERINLTESEKLAEISARRNRIERGLRVLIKNVLQLSKGKKHAGQAVVGALTEKRRNSVKSKDIDLLLHKINSLLYFSELISIINREWNFFENVFDMEKQKVILILNDINKSGRPDAHANSISKDDFTQIRLYFKKLESILENLDFIT